MAWPPPVQPINRGNASDQLLTHADDHNKFGIALNDTVARIQDDIACRKHTTTGGSIPKSAWTMCTTGATVGWTYGDIRGDTTSIISDSGGFFLLIGLVYWGTSDGTGRRMVGFSSDTATSPTTGHYAATAGTTQGQVQVVSVVMYKSPTAAGRFVLWAYQDSAGGTLTIDFREAVVIRLTTEY